MRKFLMAAGLLALVACGEKKPDANAAGTMAPPPAATMTDTTKKDTSMVKDTGMKKDTGMAAAPKKP